MKIFGKQTFFRGDMAGFGKYHMGGYGRIWVYRVKARTHRPICRGFAEKSATDSVIVGQLSEINMFNILDPLPTIGVG